MKTWDHKVIRLSGSPDEEMTSLLKAEGKQGWELVSVAVSPIPVNRRTQYFAFLKKPIEG